MRNMYYTMFKGQRSREYILIKGLLSSILDICPICWAVKVQGLYYNKDMNRNVAMFTNEYKKIGLNILCARRLKGLSQEELAVKSGVSRSRISDLERGKDVCKLDTLMLLAQALDIDYRDLLKSE